MITNEKKPVIVFGYDNWVVGGVEKVLGRIMEALLEKYNVVLVVPEQKEKRSFSSFRFLQPLFNVSHSF